MNPPMTRQRHAHTLHSQAFPVRLIGETPRRRIQLETIGKPLDEILMPYAGTRNPSKRSYIKAFEN